MVSSWHFWVTVALAFGKSATNAQELSLETVNSTTAVEADLTLHCQHKDGYLCFDHCFVGGKGSCAAYFEGLSSPPKTVISTATVTVTDTATVTETSTVLSTVSKTETITSAFTATVPVTRTDTATVSQTRVLTTTATTTSLSTTTTVFPPITVTMTLSGTTVYSTIPASTLTRVETVEVIQTITKGPEILIVTTVTPSPVSACAAPTAVPLGRRQSPAKKLKWGCEPGFICSPPKPAGCDVWDSLPPSNFVCQPEYCVKAPPPVFANTSHGATGWVPPNPLYFNLDPTKFGLTNKIFEKYEVVQVVDGVTATITTGDWAFRTSVEQSTSVPDTPALHRYKQKKSATAEVESNPQKTRLEWVRLRNIARRALKTLYRRQSDLDLTPLINLGDCFGSCNNARHEADNRGFVVSALCADGSVFKEYVQGCFDCLDLNRNLTQDGGTRQYVAEALYDELQMCSVNDGSTPPTGPQSEVGTEAPVTSGTQADVGTSRAPVPISFSNTTSSSGPTSTTSSGTPAQPTSGSTSPAPSRTSLPSTVPTAAAALSSASPTVALLATLLAAFFALF